MDFWHQISTSYSVWLANHTYDTNYMYCNPVKQLCWLLLYTDQISQYKCTTTILILDIEWCLQHCVVDVDGFDWTLSLGHLFTGPFITAIIHISLRGNNTYITPRKQYIYHSTETIHVSLYGTIHISLYGNNAYITLRKQYIYHSTETIHTSLHGNNTYITEWKCVHCIEVQLDNL